MIRSSISGCAGLLCAGLFAVLLGACNTMSTTPIKPTAETPTPPTFVAGQPIRINAGAEEAITDAKGGKWSADTGFSTGEGVEEGGTMDRTGTLEIKGTDRPEIYMTERYGMSYYSFKVPNGKYQLKLHFSEGYEGLTTEDERVFDYAVKDGDAKSGKIVKEVVDFSPWKAAKAQFTAYVDTIDLKVTNGQITITFTAKVENPQINAIEILPQK
jgi:hypothetical protein